jgi:hypothetical protein
VGGFTLFIFWVTPALGGEERRGGGIFSPILWFRKFGKNEFNLLGIFFLILHYRKKKKILNQIFLDVTVCKFTSKNC